jgi:hypothetical protein
MQALVLAELVSALEVWPGCWNEVVRFRERRSEYGMFIGAQPSLPIPTPRPLSHKLSHPHTRMHTPHPPTPVIKCRRNRSQGGGSNASEL